MINKEELAVRTDENRTVGLNPFHKKPKLSGKRKKGVNDIAFSLGMLSLVAAIWLIGGEVWDDRYYTAEEGLGYWLGITGGVLMLIALLYSIIKRKVKRNPKIMRYWFTAHTMFGIFGPLIILFHTTFQMGSLNGTIALVSTILVFTSGIVGRYFVIGVRSATDNAQHDRFIKYVRHWRSIHVPLLYLLFISGVIHVIAVHMY